MATLDNLDASIAAGIVSAKTTESAISQAKVIVWMLYERTKTLSIRTKLKLPIVGEIPLSIKVEKLYPLIEMWAGPEPDFLQI